LFYFRKTNEPSAQIASLGATIESIRACTTWHRNS
jgi:hypothetical protein